MKTNQTIDIDSLEISRDPIIKRSAPVSMYHAKFSSMTPGECIKCKPEQVGPIANAMRVWIRKNSPGVSIRSTVRHPKDGMGRVWFGEPKVFTPKTTLVKREILIPTVDIDRVHAKRDNVIKAAAPQPIPKPDKLDVLVDGADAKAKGTRYEREQRAAMTAKEKKEALRERANFGM